MAGNLIDTHVVYYIGGPADLRKEAKLGHPQRHILFREPLRVHPSDEPKRLVEFMDHIYHVRCIGPNVYVAIHSTLV